jgi:hypothetical protein
LFEGNTDYTRGIIIGEAGEGEEIVYAEISKWIKIPKQPLLR